MAKNDLLVVRGPLSAGYLTAYDLKAIRAIYESLAMLISIGADKDRVLAAVRIAEDAAIRAVEAGSSAAKLAEESSKTIAEASERLKREVEEVIQQTQAARDEVNAKASEVAKNASDATSAAEAAALDRQAVEEMKTAAERFAQSAEASKDAAAVSATSAKEDAESAARGAQSASQSALKAEQEADSAGYSFRHCGTAQAGATIALTELDPSTNAKVGDHVVNDDGLVFRITAVAEDTFTVGDVVASIKGATGEKGDAGVASWGAIKDKPSTFPPASTKVGDARDRDDSKPTYGLE